MKEAWSKDVPLCASAPHHITAAFSPRWTEDRLTTGSVGVGLAVEPRLTICTGTSLGGPVTSTADKVLKLLGVEGVTVSASRALPWGVGYASSGASAVAAALLASALRGVSISRSLQAAHAVEVEDRTGLGDVLAISCGIGVVLRRRPGAPGLGEVDCVPAPPSVSVVTLETGFMSTQELLSSLGQNYYSASEDLVKALDKDLSFDRFTSLVTQFTESLGLARWLLGEGADEVIRRTPGLIGYYVKKRLLVLLVERDEAYDAVKHLTSSYRFKARLLEPSREGPSLTLVA
ncbi:MAG: hypothetical protein L7G95_02165 [Acidilobus sp.]|nr:hypothetical protein [Acidilobus sp.]MCG2896141.1 hypothetical protein [Acidilobus sp.]